MICAFSVLSPKGKELSPDGKIRNRAHPHDGRIPTTTKNGRARYQDGHPRRRRRDGGGHQVQVAYNDRPGSYYDNFGSQSLNVVRAEG